MNGKFVFVFFIAVSVVCSLLMTQMCTFKVEDKNNPMLALYNAYTINSVSALKQNSCQTGGEQDIQWTQLDLNGSFSDKIASTTDKNTGVASNAFGFSFVDVVKLILTFISALLGIPILLFFYQLGTPLPIYFLVIVPIFTIYILSFIEFLRGGAL